MSQPRTLVRVALLFVMALVVFAARQAPVATAATPTDLFFSEYLESQPGNRKAVEIYNGTASAITLTGVYNVAVYSNGSATATATINLTGSIAAGDVFVLAHTDTPAATGITADQTSSSLSFNGDDAVALRNGTTLVDVIGQIGTDPGTEWGTGLASTVDNTIRRKSTICAGDTNGADAFDPATEWDGYADGTVDGFGSHTANCAPSSPVINEMQVNTDGDDWEFVELYGPAAYDLSALTLIGVESDTGTSAGTIDKVISLSGQTIPADGFWVAAAPPAETTYGITADLDITLNSFENSTATYFLVSGFTGAAGNDLDTDNNGTLDVTPWTAIVDSINIRDASAGDFDYGATSRGPDGSNLPSGVFRCPNGGSFSTTFHNFITPDGTPGVSNGPLCGEDVAPTVDSTTPADNATNVALDADISITFSEAVTVSGAWYTISCANSGAHTATVSGGPTTYTFDPDTDFTASELCTVTIESTLVADQDGTADNMAADYTFDFTTTAGPQCGLPGATPIHDIQGNGATSPVAGQSHTIEGIVVADYQDFTADPPNELSGFVVQEEDGDVDADPNTSEGVFVFDGQSPATDVAAGDKVRVTGTVSEFGDAPDTYTQISGSLVVEVCSTSNALPTAATINLPVSSLSDYEKYESMLVTFPQELTVTEIFTLGRFGEVLLSANGRLWNPTHEAEPGAAAAAVEAANILRSITLDDALTNQNPDPVIYPAPGLSASNTLRGGDTTTGLTGIMQYFDTTEEFRIQPTGTVTWDHENPRPADPPAVDGDLKVVGANVLNYFVTIDPNSNDDPAFTADDVCGPNYDGDVANGLECRGADSADEFTRQRDKILNMLYELDADIVGLNELENNANAAPANDDTDPVLQDIVNGLNALHGGTVYDFIDAGAIGTDAIKIALIYKPGSVTPVGDFEILDSSYDADFIDTRNRPVLAQTFEDNNGGVFTVAVAHLKSKGSGCGAGDDQPDSGGGNCNGTRTAAAEVMVDWFANHIVPTSGDPDILLVGDLNSYAKEDPIDVFVNAGFVDLAATLVDPYSYVFDGEWGYLDYAMANASMAAQVAGVAEWHINADEPIVLDYNTEFKNPGQITSFYDDDPFRASDHDPIIVGLNPTVPDTTAPTVTINQAIGQDDPTSSSPINFTVVFSETVSGFTDGDVTLGGTAGATTAVVTEIAPNDGTTYNVAVSGMTNDGTVIASIPADVAEDAASNGNEASTSIDNTVTYVAPVVVTTEIYVSTVTPGNVGPVNFGNEDILLWDGSAWSVWFDGSAAGLMPNGKTKHNINAFYISENGSEILMSFVQNARVVDGIPGKVNGMDLVEWDGSAFSLVFDGQDVGLTVLTQEKIDGLHELDASLAPAAVVAAAGGSCERYFLISTAGNGKVPNYDGTQMKISGEDVLGFCATQLGDTTAGKWHMVLDGSAEGTKPNAIVNLSASDDGQTLFLTTKAAFNVDNAAGGHSMVYTYDMVTGTFSGPYFSAPATGLTAKLDGLQVEFLPANGD